MMEQTLTSISEAIIVGVIGTAIVFIALMFLYALTVGKSVIEEMSPEEDFSEMFQETIDPNEYEPIYAIPVEQEVEFYKDWIG